MQTRIETEPEPEPEPETEPDPKPAQIQSQKQKLLDSSRHWRIDLVYGRQRDAIIMHPHPHPGSRHPPAASAPAPPPPCPPPSPRRVSDSYHYGACPAAPRVQHAATCPAGFDATCHAALPSNPPPPLPPPRCLCSCLFFMSSATNRTRFPHEWATTSRIEPGYLSACLSWPHILIPSSQPYPHSHAHFHLLFPPESCCSCCVCLID